MIVRSPYCNSPKLGASDSILPIFQTSSKITSRVTSISSILLIPIPPLLFSTFPNAAFTLRASAGRLDGPTAWPAAAPNSAPRTEIMTVAPASVPSWHLEVRSFPHLIPNTWRLSLSRLNVNPPTLWPDIVACLTNKPMSVNQRLKVDFFETWLKFLDLWFPPQVGGLRLADHPIWMVCITPAHPVWFATTALSGTIGKDQIWWRPWQPWWCAQQTSNGCLFSVRLSSSIMDTTVFENPIRVRISGSGSIHKWNFPIHATIWQQYCPEWNSSTHFNTWRPEDGKYIRCQWGLDSTCLLEF